MPVDYGELERAGIANVLISYHGAGDEGWIEDIDPDGPPLTPELERKLRDVAHELLYENCPGWEIDIGSSGTMKIDVEQRKTFIDQGWRYENVRHEKLEV